MGVSKYVARNKVRWRVDTYVTLPDGTVRRLKRGRIPTREQAQALARQIRQERIGEKLARVLADSFQARQNRLALQALIGQFGSAVFGQADDFAIRPAVQF